MCKRTEAFFSKQVDCGGRNESVRVSVLSARTGTVPNRDLLEKRHKQQVGASVQDDFFLASLFPYAGRGNIWFLSVSIRRSCL